MTPATRHRRALRPCLGLLAACLAAWSGTAPSQAVTDAGGHWRALARIDSDAALALIEQSHPGAAVELHDTAFQALLDTAKRHLDERLPQVHDYPGYAAVMTGLAVDFKDGHIWSRAKLAPVYTQWTGILLSRRARAWIVTSQIPIPGEPDVNGAHLVSCDGVDAETWARNRIDLFHGNAQVEAELANAATWLLLDEGNPFLKRPGACTFQRDGGPLMQVRLSWGGGSRDVIDDAVDKANPDTHVGLGIKPFAGGYWISMGTLQSEALQLVADAQSHQAELRESPIVVVDLRGNGGGNSLYAQQLAQILAGKKRVAALDGPSSCSGAYWRVSAGNIDARTAWRSAVNAGQLAEYDATTQSMRKALASGKPFSPALPACASHATAAPMRTTPLSKLPPSLSKGRWIVVTDHACFSSCLLAVNLFRQLGATQVGEATDMSTRYMEVRQVQLPSGLSYFSTLQKVALGSGNFGPYEPDTWFPGNMHDTDALQAWVQALPR